MRARIPDHLVPQLREQRLHRGLTYAELRDWLEARHSVVVSLSAVWRKLTPKPRVRRKANARHARWRELSEAGMTQAAIAKREGVSRQAVHAALALADPDATMG